MEIGIIGTGDMGKIYAREFSRAGYKVNCSDLPENRENLEKNLAGTGVNILDDGVAVSRSSDLIFYLVPIESLEKAVIHSGPSTKKDAIVSSGTSVMAPSVDAFEKYLPSDVNIINWHWLFGPSIKPQGQRTALVNHRSNKIAFQRGISAFETIKTKIIELPTYLEHDQITADTQAATHVGFESMGTAWKNMGIFPWENQTYFGGIDNIKVLMCLRIYVGKSHVYSGLAIHNFYAKQQIKQYANSVFNLFSLMIQEDEGKFRERILKVKEGIFNNGDSPILLDDKVMGNFSLEIPTKERTPNSHLSLLSMADAWYQSNVNPYKNMLCQTPLFRLRLGIVENLFRNSELLEETIQAALQDKKLRRDDLEFQTAVREWSTIIGNSDIASYHRHFNETKKFFANRIPEGKNKSDQLLEKLREYGPAQDRTADSSM
ncbi:prephenate dehydrogenase [Candidatus Pacearchaeota archaeon]|nr:prephenate dehydrogenase [Candidatus Pacearchaeota archaeon]